MSIAKNLNVFKIVALVLILACFIMLFLPWLTADVTAIYSSSTYRFNVFHTGLGDSSVGTCTSFWSVMLVVFAILFILCIFLAAYGILTDRSTLVLPIAVLAFLMFFFAVFQRAYAGAALSKAVSNAYGGMPYVNNLVSSFVKFHVGAGAWLFFFLGLAAYGVILADNYLARRPLVNFADFRFSGVSVPTLKLGGWTCPGCGAAMSGSQQFCTQCGTKRPETPRCPGCGKPIAPGTAFCPNCGTPVGK